MMYPPSPWIGSTKIAATSRGLTCRASRSSSMARAQNSSQEGNVLPNSQR